MMTKRVPIVMLPFTVSRHMPGACAGLHRPAASLVHFWLLPVPQPHRITDEPVVVPPPLTSKQKVLPDVDAVWMRLGLGSTPDTNAWLPGWLLEPVQVARATRLLQSLLPLTCRHRELVLPPTRRELGTVIGPDSRQLPLTAKTPFQHVASGWPANPLLQVPAQVWLVGVPAGQEKLPLVMVAGTLQDAAAAATNFCDGASLQGLITSLDPVATIPVSESRHIPGALRGTRRPALSAAHFWLLLVPQLYSVTAVPAAVLPA